MPKPCAPDAWAPQRNTIAAYMETVRVSVPSQALQRFRRKKLHAKSKDRALLIQSAKAMPLRKWTVCECQPSGGGLNGGSPGLVR